MASKTGNYALGEITSFLSRLCSFNLNHHRPFPAATVKEVFIGPRCQNNYCTSEAILLYRRRNRYSRDIRKIRKVERHYCTFTPPMLNLKLSPESDEVQTLENSQAPNFAEHIRTKSKNELELTSDPNERPELIPDKVRQIMRRIPQSIAILTTSTRPRLLNQAEDSMREASDVPICIGITLSSVSTVTLKPEPIISFNIKTPSHTLDALRRHGHFLLHFPSCSKDGALLADNFSRGFLQVRDLQAQSFDKSTYLKVVNSQGRQFHLPALFPPAYPVNYIFRCEVYGENGYIEVADHVIVVGKVLKTWSFPSTTNCKSIKTTATHTESDDYSSLAYYNGAYCFAGQKLSP